MHGVRSVPARLVVFAALLAGVAHAQQPGSALPLPRLNTVFPPGAKAGTTVDVSWTGSDLEEPQALLFSHPGIKAEPIIPPAPAVDPKKPPPMPPPKPPVTQFKVTVAPNTPLGNHDVRLVNKWGASNARTFVVGDLAEVNEKEPNNNDVEAQKVPLNTTINGTIAAGTDVDYFSFSGNAGQRVLVNCRALSIDSRLQPFVEVYDARGRQLAANHRYQGNRHYMSSDALADVTLPEAGDYLVRLSNFTYTQGSAEHFYRLTIGNGPWIDAVQPCVVEPGKSAQVTVYGRNLPGGTPDPTAVVEGRVLEKAVVAVNVPGDPPSLQRLAFSGLVSPSSSGLNGFEHRVTGPAGVSNPYLLTYATAPVVRDNDANETPETAQEIAVPCEISGRVEKRRDRDWYAFTAKKGDTFQIEAFGDRLGSPADIYFVLRNAMNGQVIFESQDNGDTLSNKFFARTDDPLPYSFAVPADGKYQLLVSSRSADSVADPRHIYRVRVGSPQPDYQLIVLPAEDARPESCSLPQGCSQAFTVIAWRRDGMNADITVAAEGLPPGVTCPPQTIGGSIRQATLSITAAPDAAAFTGEIRFKGTATFKGQTLVRDARPASITWAVQPGTNIPAISRLERSLVLAIRDKGPFALTTTIDKPAIIQGDKGSLKVAVNRISPDVKNPLQVQAVDLPANLTVNNNQALAIAPTANDGTLAIVVNANVVPGTYNLVLRGTTQIPFNKDPKAAQKPATNVVLFSTPVTLTVLPKTVANVTAAVPNANLKVGTQGEIVVQVARQFDYAGPFKVELVLPPNVKATADAATIAAGANEVKLVLKVAADAPPGALAGLSVKATATLAGNVAIVQESAKFNVNVVK